MDVGVGAIIKLLTNGGLWRWAREDEKDGAPDVCDLRDQFFGTTEITNCPVNNLASARD
jgi:hypothetical protein